MNHLDFQRVGPPRKSHSDPDQMTHAESVSLLAEYFDEIQSLRNQLAADAALIEQLGTILQECSRQCVSEWPALLEALAAVEEWRKRK